MTKETQLMLTQGERDALLTGWGVVCACLLESELGDQVAEMALDKLKGQFKSSATSLTTKLQALQNVQLEELMAGLRERVDEITQTT